jgi:hypothetical protein
MGFLLFLADLRVDARVRIVETQRMGCDPPPLMDFLYFGIIFLCDLNAAYATL